MTALVVGLGNWEYYIITDALGPTVVSKAHDNQHLKKGVMYLIVLMKVLGPVCAVAPGY